MSKVKSIIKTLFGVSAFIYLTGISINSIYPLLIAVILYFFFESKEKKTDIYTKLCAGVFGIFAMLDLFQVTVYPDQLGNLPAIFKAIKITVTFFGVFFFIEKVLGYLYGWMEHLEIRRVEGLTEKGVFFISLLILLLFYIPVWMMEYPSNIGADTLSQIKQLLSGNFVNHHPYAHTLWLGLLMSFGEELNEKIGIAALLQLILNAVTFSFVVKEIYRKTGNKFISFGVLGFYALCSFHAFLSITLMKDVTHATITVILGLLIYRYFEIKERKKLRLFFVGVFSVAFCLFRTNGFYAFLFMTAISIFVCFKKKDIRLCLVFVISLILASIIKGPIYTLLGVGEASFAEMLSIPLQQIALVIKDGYSLTEYQSEMLNRLFDTSLIPELYDEFLSDPIKNLLNQSGNMSYLKENIFEYFKLWVSIGLRHPLVYIRAWANQVGTFFSPRYYGTSLYWGIIENKLGITGNAILIKGQIRKTLRELAYNQHNIPLLGIFHYPAIYTWILNITFFDSLRKKKTASMLFDVLLIGLFLTLMISCPYNICFRYYYAVVCAMPIFILFSLTERREEK